MSQTPDEVTPAALRRPTQDPAPTQPHLMRISDGDRHQVAEVLREAAGAGRLDFEELDERLDATWSAKVYADLLPILADLPEGAAKVPALPAQPVRGLSSAAPRPPEVTPGSVPHGRSAIAVMSGTVRKGVWEVGSNFAAFAMMGGVELDLREAVFTSRELVITANTVMGGIDITVNAGTRLIVEGIGLMGGYDHVDKVPAVLSDDSPVVRVRGVALMGGVSVVRRQMPGEPKPPRVPRLRR